MMESELEMYEVYSEVVQSFTEMVFAKQLRNFYVRIVFTTCIN